MKAIYLMTGFFSCLFAAPAVAGGFDILGQPNDVLFEPGRYVEFGLGLASPSVQGQITAVGPPFASGDTAPTLPFYIGAFKADINEQFSGAIIVDNPYGRNLEYDTGPLSGLTGEVESFAVTGLLRYKLTDRFSVFGGPRLQRLGGHTDIAVFAGGVPAGFANVEFEDTWAAGYAIGGAFEIPEAHVRVAVTYNSAIDYDLDTSGAYVGTTSVEMPQSVNIDLQAPVSLSTLLFATVRWAEWSEATIRPPGYPLGSLTHFNDTTTYRLGVLQMFDENWAGFTALTYEPETGISADAPIDATDGLWGATIGAIYTQDQVRVTAAVSYYQFGDASGSFANFTDNDVVSAALKVGYSF
ncbi:OmpP1/FadL family transporter [Ensifer sp. LCM 4579]|uniref:OmpP1/FadL family transporter n=1 Tax=Ensifer sp. LCM 4579 TaxID=1848292 RepID=UPI0008DA6E9F|nr:outer membrane protein transport protein [Ensifer sp. LCM 4579]OHV81277.1 long-chain fatty acid transporter [Ensifer sp. LCM 4579]